MKDRNLLNCKASRQKRQIYGILQFNNKGTNGKDSDIVKIRNIIQKDCKFLKSKTFVDYSVLLAVEIVNPLSQNGFLSLKNIDRV